MPGKSQYKYADVTWKIIGCAMKVHRYFGKGFPEVIYHRALMIEFRNNSIQARSEVEEIVKYYNEVVGRRRVDIIVEEKILIELKAINELDPDCSSQVLNCLRVFNFEVGLLLNFGKSSLEFKRFANTMLQEE